MPGGHAASACPYTTNAAFVASQQPSAPVPAAARPPETSPQTRTTSQHRTITQPRLRRSPVGVGDGHATLVAGDWGDRFVQFEVGRGDVQEQQVDIEVKQVGNLVEHLLL